MKEEPLNSWEVSYVISIRKPHIDLLITREEIIRKIGSIRALDLKQWSDRYFSHKWFVEHI
jgi:hypothetical protein